MRKHREPNSMPVLIRAGKTQRMYYMSTNSERDWQIAKINSYCNYLSKRKSRQHLLNAAGLDSD